MYQLFVFDLDGTLVDSRRDIADSANVLLETCGARPLPEETIGRMVGDGAATLVARAFAASGLEPPPDALERFLAIYDTRLLLTHAAVSTDGRGPRGARHARGARRADQQAAGCHPVDSRGAGSRPILRRSGGCGRRRPVPEKTRSRRPPAPRFPRRCIALRSASRRRLARRLPSRTECRHRRLPGALRVRVRGVSSRTSSARRIGSSTPRPTSWFAVGFLYGSLRSLVGLSCNLDRLTAAQPDREALASQLLRKPALSLFNHCASPEVP